MCVIKIFIAYSIPYNTSLPPTYQLLVCLDLFGFCGVGYRNQTSWIFVKSFGSTEDGRDLPYLTTL